MAGIVSIAGDAVVHAFSLVICPMRSSLDIFHTTTMVSNRGVVSFVSAFVVDDTISLRR